MNGLERERVRWWQRAVFYQVYPRSFADGNGDGVGDFPGIRARLDHLADLGIDAIWLSPHYPSPFLDCGYDISNLEAVAPEYGTMDDFRAFVEGAHAREIRVILDLVLNHTSDRHPWFQAARSSRDDPKRDWYVWRDGVDGGPPNDWVSIMGGSAWQLDPTTGQYYYHAFLPEQPDLDWRNAEVRRAMFGAARFWLDLGVDGFRLDAISTLFEDAALRPHGQPLEAAAFLDANQLDADEYRRTLAFQVHLPDVHDVLRELRAIVDGYPGDRVLVGEEEDLAYHGTDDEVHLVFNFPLMRTERLTPEHVRDNQRIRLAAFPPGAWPCNTLGNHDTRRVLSRYGDGRHDEALARVHVAMLLTLPGTPFLYYGEEIGMRDLELRDPADLRDSAAIRRLARMLAIGVTPAEAATQVLATTRDRSRGPMHWTSARHAGFCPPTVTPWLPVDAAHADGVNVADQRDDPGSLLSFYRRLLHLRRATPALVVGDYEDLGAAGPDCLAYLRRDPDHGRAVAVLLNMSDAVQRIDLGLGPSAARVLLAEPARALETVDLDIVTLPPHAVLIVALE